MEKEKPERLFCTPMTNSWLMMKNLFFFIIFTEAKTFDFPYWNYTRFDWNQWTNDECSADFRFHKADVYRLFHALHIPGQIITYNRSLYDGLEAFCVFLKCYAYPCRYSDLVLRFGRLPQNSAWCQTALWILFMKIITIFRMISTNLGSAEINWKTAVSLYITKELH